MGTQLWEQVEEEGGLSRAEEACDYRDWNWGHGVDGGGGPQETGRRLPRQLLLSEGLFLPVKVRGDVGSPIRQNNPCEFSYRLYAAESPELAL